MKRVRRERNAAALEQFRLGRTLAARGERDRAIEAYLRAIGADPDFAEAHVNLGVLYGSVGEPAADEALRCLRRGVELNPASARAQYNLGVALARRGQADPALAAFEEAVRLDPGHRNALYALAVQWNRRGDPVQAGTYHRRYQAAMGQRTGAGPEADAGGASGEPRGALAMAPKPKDPSRLRIRFVR